MEKSTREKSASVAKERAILVSVLLPGHNADPHDPLGELHSLADTAGAVVVGELMQNRHKPDAGTFLGTGKVIELGQMVEELKAQIVIFDNDLSPSQIGNIEDVVKVKVIDRSELILDIFAGRAQTHEAKLQVELAQLQYTYPRLRAMWTHLERIVGGIGTRGPGEQQLEIDRRLVQKKVTQLRREILEVQERKTREVAARNRDFFTIGLVGYTNAGKSTLFNTATDGGAYADDKLFATLSTRTRKWELGGGDTVMLSDTVGFVRDLPHHLVASFKATLEEAIHSDILLMVLDVADPRAQHQLDTVMEVLDDVGAKTQRRLLILNKVDKLEHNADLLVFQQKFPDSIALSAKTGRGMNELVELIRSLSRGRELELQITVPHALGRIGGFLESRTVVLDRQFNTDHTVFSVRIGARQLDQVYAMGSNIKVIDSHTGEPHVSGTSWRQA
jgi:GTPase